MPILKEPKGSQSGKEIILSFHQRTVLKGRPSNGIITKKWYQVEVLEATTEN